MIGIRLEASCPHCWLCPLEIHVAYVCVNFFWVFCTYIQVVSDDGTRVKREQPFTELDLEELQVTRNSLLYIERHYHVNIKVLSRYHTFARLSDIHIFCFVGPNCCCRKSPRWSFLPESDEALFSCWQVNTNVGLYEGHHFPLSHEKWMNHKLNF